MLLQCTAGDVNFWLGFKIFLVGYTVIFSIGMYQYWFGKRDPSNFFDPSILEIAFCSFLTGLLGIAFCGVIYILAKAVTS